MLRHLRQAARPRPKPRLPNLLCLGVEKCGTTFLNAAFAGSPSVLTPRKKELFFFNEYYHEGSEWYLSWYDFDAKPAARYVIDVTPSYFRLGKNLDRITGLLPDARVIMVLRHPVYRAFSHYVHRLRHKALQLEPYGYSFQDILARKDRYRLLCPKYGWHMHTLLEFFRREDILLLTYEEDILNPISAQRKLSRFLDLPDLDFSHMAGRRVNEGSMPRFYYAGSCAPSAGIDGRGDPLPEGTLLLAHAQGTRRWDGIDPALARANLDAAEHWTRGLHSAEVAAIYEAHFAADLETLRSEFGLDIDRWRRMNDAIHYRPARPDAEISATGG